MSKQDFLNQQLETKAEEFGLKITNALGEITVNVKLSSYINFLLWLRDDLSFEQLIDLCGIDYSEYANHEGGRYGVVLHLLSIKHISRLRVKVLLEEDSPIVPSVTQIWSSSNWYEREAFDLYGILFEGHNDLRRILTDYGFIGHPMKKDFPTTGFVEMRYDEEQKRVVYQPVTIEERQIIPRIIREETYAQ